MKSMYECNSRRQTLYGQHLQGGSRQEGSAKGPTSAIRVDGHVEAQCDYEDRAAFDGQCGRHALIAASTYACARQGEKELCFDGQYYDGASCVQHTLTSAQADLTLWFIVAPCSL